MRVTELFNSVAVAIVVFAILFFASIPVIVAYAICNSFRECDPDGNGKDPDASNDIDDHDDYDSDEVATEDKPEDKQN